MTGRGRRPTHGSIRAAGAQASASTATASARADSRAGAAPRIGFAGVGWIGRARLDALAQTGLVEVAAVADPDDDAREDAAAVAPDAARLGGFDALLEQDLDGVVIATPSAMHADQTVAALERGLAVFCQKPLGRTAAETARAVAAARERDLPLGVDFCYRHARAAEVVRELVTSGAIGRVYAADLTFHNAYGPDKEWFYDPASAGGGCLIDLGIHLVDLALWTLGYPEVERADGRLFARGEPWAEGRVEDYVEARLDLAGGATARVSCSWNLPADRDAIIQATFYGSGGAARMRNVRGSFYDFVGERVRDGHAETLAEPPDAWGGRAIAAWAAAVARGDGFDAATANAVAVAEALDRIYGRAT